MSRPQHTKFDLESFQEIYNILYKEKKMDDTTNNAVITKDKQSSIEVSRNAKGDYAFKVKTYYNQDDVYAKTIVELNKSIMVQLMSEFD